MSACAPEPPGQPDGTHLRPATLGDVSVLVRIHRTALEQALPGLPNIHSHEEDLAWMAGLISGEMEVTVAERAAEAAGPAPEAAGFLVRQARLVHSLYVAPAHWSRGVGTLLLDRAKAVSPALELWTFQRNHRARRFYEHHGFTVVRFTDGETNEIHEPDVLYAWTRAATGA